MQLLGVIVRLEDHHRSAQCRDPDRRPQTATDLRPHHDAPVRVKIDTLVAASNKVVV